MTIYCYYCIKGDPNQEKLGKLLTSSRLEAAKHFAAKLDNDVFIFAGGATKLFRVDNDDLSLVDESKAGGYTGLNRWQFLQFGSLALASNGSEKIQSFDVNSSTAFADVSSDAPIAKYITAVRDFVVAGNIGAGTSPNKVQWSGINDATTRLNMSPRKWDKELKAYRNARAQGIQPDGTSMKQIEKAVKISDKTGKAYGA